MGLVDRSQNSPFKKGAPSLPRLSSTALAERAAVRGFGKATRDARQTLPLHIVPTPPVWTGSWQGFIQHLAKVRRQGARCVRKLELLLFQMTTKGNALSLVAGSSREPDIVHMRYHSTDDEFSKAEEYMANIHVLPGNDDEADDPAPGHSSSDDPEPRRAREETDGPAPGHSRNDPFPGRAGDDHESWRPRTADDPGSERSMQVGSDPVPGHIIPDMPVPGCGTHASEDSVPEPIGADDPDPGRSEADDPVPGHSDTSCNVSDPERACAEMSIKSSTTHSVLRGTTYCTVTVSRYHLGSNPPPVWSCISVSLAMGVAIVSPGGHVNSTNGATPLPIASATPLPIASATWLCAITLLMLISAAVRMVS